MRTYYYPLRSPRLWWARIWVTSDGLVTIASDFGYFGHWFDAPGGEIRRFLTGVEPEETGYMARKLAKGKSVYDADATVSRIREEIVRKRRENPRRMSREDARELWDSVREFELDNNDHRASSWLDDDLVQKHFGCEAYELSMRTLPGDVRGFMRDVWPVFVEELKRELHAERASAIARGEMLEMGV